MSNTALKLCKTKSKCNWGHTIAITISITNINPTSITITINKSNNTD